ncbi:MAG TPA: hypothetical protein VMT54_08970 [Candidatus Cybelea sp.]|nr:hypothetical protein [Candidatus Cybelea sp.]
MQTHALYDTLFGDLPLSDWARHGDRLDTEPWRGFARAAEAQARGNIAEACRNLNEIATATEYESRHIIEAWNALRELNCPEARRAEPSVLGVVIEASAEGGAEGHDILAVYADRNAYYLDHAGGAVIWQAANVKLDEEIKAVLAAAAEILPRIGPWQGKRPAPPPKGNVRLNILTPVGLCFGEGPFAAIARDTIAGPLVKAGATLVHRLSMLPKETVN